MKWRIKAIHGDWLGVHGDDLGRDMGGPTSEAGIVTRSDPFAPPPGVKMLPLVFSGREAEETGAIPVWRPET